MIKPPPPDTVTVSSAFSLRKPLEPKRSRAGPSALGKLPTVQRQWKAFKSLTASLALRIPSLRRDGTRSFKLQKKNPIDDNSHVNNRFLSDIACPEDRLPRENSRQ